MNSLLGKKLAPAGISEKKEWVTNSITFFIPLYLIFSRSNLFLLLQQDPNSGHSIHPHVVRALKKNVPEFLRHTHCLVSEETRSL